MPIIFFILLNVVLIIRIMNIIGIINMYLYMINDNTIRYIKNKIKLCNKYNQLRLLLCHIKIWF